MTKKELRKQMLTRRNALSPEDISEASSCICSRITDSGTFQKAESICLYMPIRNEVDVTPLFEQCFQSGKNVWLPKITDNRMDFFLYERETALIEGVYRIAEPDTDICLNPNKNTLIIMPGAVFSVERFRIGYGGGYYDSYIEAHPSCTYIAVCYDFQILDAIPHESHDKKPSAIVSEKRWLS